MNNLRLLLLGFIVVLILVMNAKAEEKAPAPFQNSAIERKLENGKVQKFDGNQYMIVRRGTKTEPKVIVKEKKVYKKNSLKLYVGYGPNEVEQDGINAKLDSDPLLGVGYQRMLNEDFSLEVIGITNESLLIGGGYHF